jgi:two-component system, chemotaxis family, chemotaxis protein CheY
MRHVLVVDDSTVIRKIVRRVLEGMDLEVTEASDVRQALAVCSLSMPDAIFVDGGMPTLDGCEFLRKLRRMHGGDGPKAVIACGSERFHDETIRCGACEGKVRLRRRSAAICNFAYSVTGESSVISGAASGPAGSDDPPPPNP